MCLVTSFQPRNDTFYTVRFFAYFFFSHRPGLRSSRRWSMNSFCVSFFRQPPSETMDFGPAHTTRFEQQNIVSGVFVMQAFNFRHSFLDLWRWFSCPPANEDNLSRPIPPPFFSFSRGASPSSCVVLVLPPIDGRAGNSDF